MIGAAVVAAVVIGGVAATTVLAPAGPLSVTVVQDGLEHPWDLAFADDGRMVVTERIGRVRVFAGAEPDGELLHTETIPDVRAELESGLMGVAVAGDTVLACATRGPTEDPSTWRVELLRSELASDGTLSTWEVVPLEPTIGGPRHQGCAVEIGPDGNVWLTIGDANLPAGENPAQDPTTLNGKVLRIAVDGTIPDDNPISGSPVMSLGHRNPQGLAFDADGRPFAVEHGTDVNDEINRIEAGGNYGYPCWTGADAVGPIPGGCGPATDYLAPAWASGAPTLATSGAAFLSGPAWGDWTGDLVVTTLKEEDLRRFSVAADGSTEEVAVFLDRAYGRLRAAVIGPDGALYLTTSNGDDRILRVERSQP